MKTNIQFIKLRVPALLISLVFIIVALWFLLGSFIPGELNLGPLTPRGFNLGIDFQGGMVQQITVYSGIDQDKVRQFSMDAGLGKEVQEVIQNDNKRIGTSNSFLIKTIITQDELKTIQDEGITTSRYLDERVKKLYAAIIQETGETYVLEGDELARANVVYPDEITGEDLEARTETQRVLDNVVKESDNVIAPVYAKGLRLQVTGLVVFLLLVMLLYITFRFKYIKYGIGAVFALFHDVIIILGFVAIFGLELNYTIIAAVLTIVGYSLNDTIVIFDRIRENFGIMKESTSRVIINTSINQSLSRTIITSVTTLLAVVALYVWGGPKIENFALTLIVGIVCGTYSSIFIASPTVDSWETLFASKKEREKKKKKELKQEQKQQKVEDTTEESEESSTKNTAENVKLSKKQLKKLSGSKKRK
jgi:preprotein translocase SecF subunit